MKTMIVVGCMGFTAPVFASVVGNLSATTNYVYRGITNSANKPAIQGGFDWTNPAGWYAGIWGSSISSDIFQNNTRVNEETDFYGGYNGVINQDWNWSAGLIQYTYFGDTRFSTDEANVSLGYRWLTVKYSHELNKFYNLPDSSGSYYYEAALAVPLPENLTLGLHAGHQVVAGAANAGLNYTDYKVSLAHDFGHGYSASVNYTTTNANKALYTGADGVKTADSHVFISMTKTF
ncbi:MAG TPA: TorF family putative porin [Burkholderiales bacterium]|nr:TorF family putative porin [Burkholderiales bacterium]